MLFDRNEISGRETLRPSYLRPGSLNPTHRGRVGLGSPHGAGIQTGPLINRTQALALLSASK